MKIYELIIDEETGVDMIAFVDEPAIGRRFLAFNKDSKPMVFKVQSEEKRIVSGPIMVANLPIYRYNEEMGDHYIVFRPETIERIMQRFAFENRNGQANLMHDGVQVDNVFLFESFLIDERKMTPKGFDELPAGSWFGSFKVENDEVWARVKSGEFTGFSVEGVFNYKETDTVPDKDEELLAKLIDVLSVRE